MQSDCSKQNLTSFIENLGFKSFSNELVETALTHPSYAKEQNLSYDKCYERLEFLGDAVLKMATTEYLYKKYPEKNEGELTKIRAVIVSDEIIHKVAQNIGLEKHIRLGSAEIKSQSHKLESIQACAMEALLGALYLTSDKDELKTFIIKELSDTIDDIANNNTVYNAKALLQEYTQAKTKEIPIYNVVEENGAAHDKTFTVSVSYKKMILAKAKGKTKKHAQQEAAFDACKKLGLINDKKVRETNE